MEIEVKFVENDLDIGVEFDESIKIEGGGGYEEGWNDGYADGAKKGYSDGYDDGHREGLAEGMDAGLLEGYENGYNKGFDDGNDLQYASQIDGMFYGVAFPDSYEMALDLPNCPADINGMFRTAYGIKKLTMNIPTDRTYNASYFAMGSTSDRSTLEEMAFPDGVKFSNVNRFAVRAYALTTVNCGLGENGVGIDLSECTDHTSCFDYCTELVEIRFKAETITKSISLAQSSNLSDASIDSIVEGLALVSGQTLTLHATVKGKLTPAQIATITYTKGWTLA